MAGYQLDDFGTESTTFEPFAAQFFVVHVDSVVFFWNQQVPQIVHEGGDSKFKLRSGGRSKLVALYRVLRLAYAFSVVACSARGIKPSNALSSLREFLGHGGWG